MLSSSSAIHFASPRSAVARAIGAGWEWATPPKARPSRIRLRQVRWLMATSGLGVGALLENAPAGMVRASLPQETAGRGSAGASLDFRVGIRIPRTTYFPGLFERRTQVLRGQRIAPLDAERAR